MIPFNTKG